MNIAFYILAFVFCALNLMHLVRHPHWFFKVWNFGRLQLTIIELGILLLGLFLVPEKNTVFWLTQTAIVGVIIFNIVVLLPYSPLYFWGKTELPSGEKQNSVSVISVNVYQYNTDYNALKRLIAETKPDIILTVETNKDWENALASIEAEYKHNHKLALENTYGMHFYSKLPILKAQTHFFVADDIPSFEIELETKNKQKFTFFGVHPPPPSPTEEPTASVRDGELMSVAKIADKHKNPVVVAGDFNNVAWAHSSVLFRKKSQLLDPRIGRGFVSTFHAKYRFFRFPIDLFFHSPSVFIQKFKTLSPIGSDHLPLFCTFFIHHKNETQQAKVEKIETAEEHQEVEHLVAEALAEGTTQQT